MTQPYYSDSNITLYKGDCLEILPHISQVDCVIADPPYGTTSCKWDSIIPLDSLWNNLLPLVKEDSAICIFGSEPFSSILRLSNLSMYKYDWIWDKKTGLGFLDSKFRPLKQHEIISIFSKAGCSNGSKPPMVYNPQGLIPTTKKNSNSPSNILNSEPKQRKDLNTKYTNYPKSILQYSRVQGLHPTQKPVPLLEYLIRTYSNEGDTILDFSAGSGSTGIASMNTNRKCILIEKEEQYCEVIVNRIREHKLSV